MINPIFWQEFLTSTLASVLSTVVVFGLGFFAVGLLLTAIFQGRN